MGAIVYSFHREWVAPGHQPVQHLGLTEKDDMFVRKDLLETRYKVKVEDILEDAEWSREYSFWTGEGAEDGQTEQLNSQQIHEDL